MAVRRDGTKAQIEATAPPVLGATAPPAHAYRHHRAQRLRTPGARRRPTTGRKCYGTTGLRGCFLNGTTGPRSYGTHGLLAATAPPTATRGYGYTDPPQGYGHHRPFKRIRQHDANQIKN